jgi:hypothetical protein
MPNKKDTVNVTNPVEIQKFLSGVDYPAPKQDIISKAEENNAPEEIMDLLKQLPDMEYSRPTDVTREISQLEE